MRKSTKLGRVLDILGPALYLNHVVTIVNVAWSLFRSDFYEDQIEKFKTAWSSTKHHWFSFLAHNIYWSELCICNQKRFPFLVQYHLVPTKPLTQELSKTKQCSREVFIHMLCAIDNGASSVRCNWSDHILAELCEKNNWHSFNVHFLFEHTTRPHFVTWIC